MQRLIAIVTIGLGLTLSGCSTLSGPAAEPEKQAPTTRPEVSQTDRTEQPEPPPEPEYADFSEETLYSLLAAEVAAQRGRYDVTLVNYVEAAKSSRDIGVIKRALDIARSLNGDNAQNQLIALWLDVAPDSAEAHRVAAIQKVRQKDFETALSHMETLLQQGKEADFDTLAALSSNLSDAEQERLLGLYRELEDRYPDNRDIRYGTALVLRAQGNHEGALKELQPLLDESGQKPFQPALILRGDLLYKMGRQQEALDHLRYQSRRFPDNRKLGTLYGRILIDDGQLQAAEDQFASLVERFPDTPGLKLSHALVALENGHNQVARRQLEQLLDDEHHVNEAHYYLGRLARSAGQTEEAIAHFDQVQGGGQFFDALSQSTYLRGQSGQLDQAMQRLAKLRQQMPDNNERLWLIEINTLLDLERYPEALGAATAALEKHPENVQIRYARAMLYDRLDRFKASERDLRSILDKNPENAVALNALGYLLTVETERLKEARRLLEKALSLDPENPAIIDSVGWVHYRLGNHQKALEYLRKAYEAFPDPEVAAHYGEALYVTGEEEQARVIWRRTLEEHPDDTMIRDTMERLGVERDL
ncbi:hypothetical protein CF392_01950 [Tamilnaduibacter salinus]|uniref:Tetratricopeptide repeat protein n=1 Tax=Tamilnaduibacter salinus TaxID=1484056 RepID=A0A2A2I6F3_9GAMM|nr:tetratricopeptide repeat protein [Tamilnaduibacter salinus]PAV27237.1 hypothetical protein CF392_01950 [Tamilnaduibacter salinus]